MIRVRVRDISGMLALLMFAVVPARAQSFAYVTNEGDNTVSAYAISATTGVLTSIAGSPFAAGNQPTSIALDPSGHFAYVANYVGYGAGTHLSCTQADVSAYTISATTGALSPVSGSPFAAGLGTIRVTVDPSGRFVYTANACSDNVSAYAINAATGALTPVPGSPFPAGTYPWDIAVEPSGHFAYVSNVNSDNVSVYAINATTGALTPIAGSPFAESYGPNFVTVDRSGHFAYVLNESNTVSAYTINATTGLLTPVPGSPFATETGTTAVSVDPSSQFVYVANGYSHNVSAYTINAVTGALTPVPGSPFPAGTYAAFVTVDASGHFVYVSNYFSGDISAYTINTATGALTSVAGSPFPAGALPVGITTTRSLATPSYIASIQPPINADGSSVFNAKRGAVPVKFTLAVNGTSSCQLPPATISLSRTAGGTLGGINESDFLQPSDQGSNFRIDTAACQYVYNLGSSSLGAGTYSVQINIGGGAVGTGTFSLK